MIVCSFAQLFQQVGDFHSYRVPDFPDFLNRFSLWVVERPILGFDNPGRANSRWIVAAAHRYHPVGRLEHLEGKHSGFVAADIDSGFLHYLSGNRIDLVRGLKKRVYPVGRLDYHSEGLLLLTNDGDFANRITAAARHVPKTYMVKSNGMLTPAEEEAFRSGIPLHGRRTAPAGLKLVKRAQNPWYEVRLIEGRQNQIRLMFRHFDRLVEKLKRVKIGFLELGSLRPGEFRHLAPREVERFRRLLELDRG